MRWWQRFAPMSRIRRGARPLHSDGILAFLLLSDPHLCSIVWSLLPAEAKQMQEADAGRL